MTKKDLQNKKLAEEAGWEMIEYRKGQLVGIHPMARYFDPLRKVPDFVKQKKESGK